MPDDAPPPLDPGAPRFAWFDGIVEGRLGDAAAVREAASRANETGFGRMDVGVDGGRFSVLMDDTTVLASRMTDENRRALADALNAIAAAAGGPVESTLRCTEVFANEVRETLFLPDGGAVRALTRTRPVTDADRFRDPDAVAPPPPSMGRGRLAVVLAVLLVGFGVAAWTSGWVDRLLAAKTESLSVDTGPFSDLVAVSAEKSWGNYDVTLRRGPGYPVTNDRLAELRAKAGTPAERAAIDAVASGGDVWVRLEDAKGHGLAATRTDLRALLAAVDRTSEAELPGRMTAARIRLSIEAGPEFK
jgi:hypothetical protein